MTGGRDTTDRAAEWMRYIARALALIWALHWTFVGLACSVGRSRIFDEARSPAEIFLDQFALPSLLFLVSAAIAWRWEAIGGVVLVLEGLLIFIAYPLVTYSSFPLSTIVFTLLTMALPPLVVGSLFVASWRKSKTSGMPQNSA